MGCEVVCRGILLGAGSGDFGGGCREEVREEFLLFEGSSKGNMVMVG